MNKFLLLFMLIPSLCFGNVIFDGIDDRIVSGDSDFEGMTKLSFSILVKRNGNSVSGNNGRILHKNGTFTIFWFDSDSGLGANDNDIAFGLYHLGFTAIQTTAKTTTDYINIIGVWDSGVTWKLYIDNIEVATGSKGGTGGTSVDPLILGLDEDLSTAGFNGDINEVYVWTGYILTEADRVTLNSKGKRIGLQISPANLKLYLPIDDIADGVSADGATFKDLSGNGNDGTGDDGANNTGLIGAAETLLTYP